MRVRSFIRFLLVILAGLGFREKERLLLFSQFLPKP